MPALSALLRDLRTQRRMSLAQLAQETYASRGWINNVEAGRRWPGLEWVELAESALDAQGLLTPAWHEGRAAREEEASLRNLLSAVENESQVLLAAKPDAVDLDRLSESAASLSVAYLASPARPMLEQARALRHELMRRLTAGAIRPRDLADLYVALGRVNGVISYAALDLGSPETAATHADAAWQMGDSAGDDELRAWARGTQSLIARFGKHYELARSFIDDGLRYATQGTSEIRLLCGRAQCAANMGDASLALSEIAKAGKIRDRVKKDSVEGLFGFSPAKQAYYTASSLMWLDDKGALALAQDSAVLAISTWQHEPTAQRSLDDEALAHVYLATARLKLGEIDGAMEAVRPIIELPDERQISWIQKRVAELALILDDDRFRHSVTAADAREELRASV